MRLIFFSLLQNNGSVAARNTCILKELETKLNDAVMGARNVIKSEGNLMKKCILRRSASLYTAMKRIKGGKKPRQTTTRQALKSQCANDVNNDAIICAISSEVGVKPMFLKTLDRYRPNRSNVGYVNHTESQLNKKLTAPNSSTKTNISSEETAVIRHGAKRLKIVSTRTPKALPEIGESSYAAEETGAKVSSSKMPRTCSKQSDKGTHNRFRKHCRLTEQMKSDRSSRLKEMSKTVIKKSRVLEEDAKQNSK